MYSRPEDEFYHRHCTEAYTFPLDKPVAKDELQPMRLIMLLDRAQIDKARYLRGYKSLLLLTQGHTFGL